MNDAPNWEGEAPAEPIIVCNRLADWQLAVYERRADFLGEMDV